MVRVTTIAAGVAVVAGNVAFASATVNDTTSLYGALRSINFYASGTAHSTDVYEDVNMAVSYNEPDNVTCSMCGWAVHNGQWTYPWQTADSVAASDGDGGSSDTVVMREQAKYGYENTSYVAPPLGLRSAPQLGGVSTGSVELRADGSFREWTILNAG